MYLALEFIVPVESSARFRKWRANAVTRLLLVIAKNWATSAAIHSCRARITESLEYKIIGTIKFIWLFWETTDSGRTALLQFLLSLTINQIVTV